jgi:hypothetical protein
MPFQKAVHFEDCSHDRWGTDPRCCTNLNVLFRKHFTAVFWSLITSNTIKNCFMKCGLSIDHVSSNNDSAVKKMTVTVYNFFECSLRTTQHVPVLSRSVESAVVYRPLDLYLSMPEEEPEGENKVAEHIATFSDALKGLEAARKHMCQDDTKNKYYCNMLTVETESWKKK